MVPVVVDSRFSLRKQRAKKSRAKGVNARSPPPVYATDPLLAPDFGEGKLHLISVKFSKSSTRTPEGTASRRAVQLARSGHTASIESMSEAAENDTEPTRITKRQGSEPSALSFALVRRGGANTNVEDGYEGVARCIQNETYKLG